MLVTQNPKLKTQNSTDWHCHLLPGIDDGAADMDESVEMARVLHQAGYSTVYCTPHLIKGSFEADNDTVRGKVAALQARLIEESIDLELLPGREYYLDEFLSDYLRNPLLLGETRHLLVEIPNHASPDHVKETCYRIRCTGYTPLIAHPERCALLATPEQQRDGWFKTLGSRFQVFNSKLKTQNSKLKEASLLNYLKEIGCQFQGNLGSFAGFYGERVRRQAEAFRAAGLYTHYGSDLHSARHKDILAVAGSFV